MKKPVRLAPGGLWCLAKAVWENRLSRSTFSCGRNTPQQQSGQQSADRAYRGISGTLPDISAYQIILTFFLATRCFRQTNKFNPSARARHALTDTCLRLLWHLFKKRPRHPTVPQPLTDHAEGGRLQGNRIVLPVVLRDSRARCACVASVRAKRCPMEGRSTPCSSRLNSSAAEA